MRCFFLLLISLTACTSIPSQRRPLIGTYIPHITFQRQLDLREHPDSKPWRRLFNHKDNFIVMEPGLSLLRIGQDIITTRGEIKLWKGQLYIPRSALNQIKQLLEVSAPSVVHYPEWIPVAEKTWQYIVIHHSAINTGNAKTYDRNHREVRGWSGGLGYHFLIGNGSGSEDGEVEVGPRWHRQMHGAHARSGSDNIYNLEGIGVCLVGNFNHGQRPTSRQLDSLVELVSFLRDRYNISLSNVVAHRSVPHGTVTDCPGDSFPWKEFFSQIQ